MKVSEKTDANLLHCSRVPAGAMAGYQVEERTLQPFASWRQMHNRLSYNTEPCSLEVDSRKD